MLVGREGAQKAQKKRRRVLVAFLLLGLWLIAWLGARGLIVSAPLDRADAIVVLSGSSTLAERTQQAAHLYSQNRAQKILLTSDNQRGSWSSAEQRNPYFYEIAVKELIRLGVPSENVEVISQPVTSTWDEAQAVNQYSKTHNLHSILVVTSSYHSRRALWTFRAHLPNIQVGLDPVPTGIQTPGPAMWWLYPRGWQLVFVEYLKLIYYLFRGL